MSDSDRSATTPPSADDWSRPATHARFTLTPNSAAAGLAALVLLLGLVGALAALGQGAWLDEFWTLASGPRGMPLSEFLEVMARDVHPVLHYGLVYVAQAVGLVDLGGLRALNLLGVPLTLSACWFAHRRGALTPAQGFVLVALYASSTMFQSYVAELRAYFLVFSSSIATVLVWRVLARDIAEGRTWSLKALAFWGVCLAVFVNLHYFATLLGGALTLALLALRWRGGGALAAWGRGVIPLAAVSLLAAAPAVIMALVQSSGADEGIVQWVQTGRIDGAFVIADAAWAAMAYNIPAAGCAIVAALLAFERGQALRDIRDELVLVAILAAYAFILLAINAARPIIIDRYLVALGGPVVVVAALLAGGPRVPRWGPAAACAFALLVQGRALYTESYQHAGWSTSAAAVAGLVEACPQSRVYIDPVGDTPQIRMFSTVRRYGLSYYAGLLGLSVDEAEPGDVLPPPGACPTLIWLEHYTPPPAMTGAELLRTLSLTIGGAAEILRVDSGVIIVVR